MAAATAQAAKLLKLAAGPSNFELKNKIEATMATTGPRIEIVINKKGETETSVHGVQGGSCHTVSEPYEKLFGALVETTATAEAYEDPELVEIKSQAG